jgi:HD-GYP domain-containing protein (c-di-GMP phosphodiesterase class II)
MPLPSAPTTPDPASTLAVTALEDLAARLRPGGLDVLLFRPDASLAFHDTGSALIFQRYLLPILLGGIDGARPLSGWIAGLGPNAAVQTWTPAPGLVAAAFPYVERRQLVGVVAVVGKSRRFKLSDELVQTCSALGVDPIWLTQQADALPAYDDDVIVREARLLMGMLRDQVRLTNLEQEVETLSDQLSNTYEELSLIYQISGGMRVNRGAGDFFKQACLDVMAVMEVRGIGVSVQADALDARGPMLHGPLVLPQPMLERVCDELTRGFASRPSIVLINQLAADRSLAWLSEHARRLLAVPLVRGESVLGCLFCFDKTAGDFDTADAKLLTSIANEIAIYLENAMLFEDVRGLNMGLLHALTSAVDAKDPYTCGHSERVALLARMLSEQADLPKPLCERIYMAGLLHDVGKIGVPEAVLQKTGRLTPEEFDLMKKHPEIGARILRDVRQIEDVIPGVLHHHERFDGRGYPHGLAGELIPLMGRIICLADCFDAMTSNRTYRKALPLEVTLTEIRRCAGTQFDPKLTDAFLSLGIEKLRDIIRMGEVRRLVPFETQTTIQVA